MAKRSTVLKFENGFFHLYYDYCTVMNVDCSQGTGCGYNDKCPYDSICKKGGSVA